MNRPEKNEYAAFYETYVSLVAETNIVSALEKNLDELQNLFAEISEEKGSYAYAEGKWSIRELLGHLIDGERVFSYRALRISRDDKTPLASFEENSYVANSNFGNAKLAHLIEDFADLVLELAGAETAGLIFFANDLEVRMEAADFLLTSTGFAFLTNAAGLSF